MTGHRGYSNPQGGWVDAAKATGALIKLTSELGGKVVPGAEVSEWVMEDGDVKGVKCLDGRVFKGDKIIIASGAWTQGLMKELMPEGLLTSCGITVAAFRLSEEECDRYKDIPVIMGWGQTKFYSMPVSKSCTSNDQANDIADS
jgi:sarcosine oxidase/L-pipecolate oxidase